MAARDRIRLPSLYQQLMAAAACAAMCPGTTRPAWPTNPFSAGVRDGSVTEKVLEALRSHYPRWLEHRDLMRITGGSRGAIAWAVRYLQEHSLARSIPSASCRPQGGGPQLRRYQAVIEGKALIDEA